MYHKLLSEKKLLLHCRKKNDLQDFQKKGVKIKEEFEKEFKNSSMLLLMINFWTECLKKFKNL
jgi:hypothetical protein